MSNATKNHHPRCICEDPHEPGLTTCPCIADIYGGGECEHAAKRRLEKLEVEVMEAEARKLGQSLGYSDDEIEAKLREVREARQRAAARAQGEGNVR